ncbi:hypothetical protein I5Q34_07625 [Streptomyces sp. AV19]|uniref:hypothetical protein n=1 Tax=Streptomyces sp. AV19 TaxID=2793068 RepID=UPI0018FE7B35|nr:hypothetical protein [Streptomyces sp. AV19]MBH1934166.1 hypothetical protein [Streptomyces sp. AV19]MDG4533571.1 hypothetical protein [Streptomyces sp. AV19]
MAYPSGRTASVAASVPDHATLDDATTEVRRHAWLHSAEVDTNLAGPERLTRLGGWADLSDLHSDDATLTGLLLGTVAEWLRLAGVDRLLTYAAPDETDDLARLGAAGFRELTRTARGWTAGN